MLFVCCSCDNRCSAGWWNGLHSSLSRRFLSSPLTFSSCLPPSSIPLLPFVSIRVVTSHVPSFSSNAPRTTSKPAMRLHDCRCRPALLRFHFLKWFLPSHCHNDLSGLSGKSIAFLAVSPWISSPSSHFSLCMYRRCGMIHLDAQHHPIRPSVNRCV